MADFSPEMLAMLPMWFVAFLVALTFHEAAHAWVAYLGGDRTAYLGGQVTLNPWPHVRREPFGTVLVPLLTYVLAGWMMGWASAPYDPDWARRYPRRAALMALAGPVANLVLALIALVALRAGLSAGWWEIGFGAGTFAETIVAPAGAEASATVALGRFLLISLMLNSLLGAFNLMPFPPLDGHAIVYSLVPRAREFYEKLGVGPGSVIGLLLAWLIFRRIAHWIVAIAYTGLVV